MTLLLSLNEISERAGTVSLVQLETALAMFEQDNVKAGCGVMNGYINRLGALIRGGQIPAEIGDSLALDATSVCH